MRLNSSLTFPEWYKILIIQTLFLVIMLLNGADSIGDEWVNEWMNAALVE